MAVDICQGKILGMGCGSGCVVAHKPAQLLEKSSQITKSSWRPE
jgi:hypothetical protein